jgi:hypothetical protein
MPFQRSRSSAAGGDAIHPNGPSSSWGHSSVISPPFIGQAFATDGGVASSMHGQDKEKSGSHTNVTGMPLGFQGSHVNQSMHSSSLQGIDGNDLAVAPGMNDLLPFGLSPALHPIVASDVHPDSFPNLALGLSTSQIATLLQSGNAYSTQGSGLQ